MTDTLDAIMQVMTSAFDPSYGEAWNRRQVEDAMVMPNTYVLLAGRDGTEPADPSDTLGFAMSRGAADEEELLLIAVKPSARGLGIGSALMRRFMENAEERGAVHLFLEMRERNPAQNLYERCGFVAVGRRRHYYRSGNSGPMDAITFVRQRD